ncbi:SpoIIIAH-like family protein [Ammonifex thiophilus]|uniref:SpoIIIAH-like family protein n=1 Tax=Ammonifex thiophilus TaxID=444093 RepID=A0A3D8P534_9THEO|nr:SpoIIIAH-like family protein [Ammonifex thiophilus]RDV82503.1 SpoIIIAH-like family protein [Ammonifex thiophilus]
MRLVLVRRSFLAMLVLLLLLGGSLPGLLKLKEMGKPCPSQAEEKMALPRREAKDGFFADFRLEKESRRSQQVELLREIAKDPGTSAATRREAQEKIMELTRRAEKEAWLEGLLKAQGFEEAVVTIEERGIITVILPRELSVQETERVVELVSRATGRKQEEITVVTRKSVVPRKGEGV